MIRHKLHQIKERRENNNRTRTKAANEDRDKVSTKPTTALEFVEIKIMFVWVLSPDFEANAKQPMTNVSLGFQSQFPRYHEASRRGANKTTRHSISNSEVKFKKIGVCKHFFDYLVPFSIHPLFVNPNAGLVCIVVFIFLLVIVF